MSEDLDDNKNNQTYPNVIAKIAQTPGVPQCSNTFNLEGNKVKLKLLSGKELLVEQCTDRGIFTKFLRNVSKKNEIILIENIISIRCKDCLQLAPTASSSRPQFKLMCDSVNSLLRLNQTLTITHSPQRKKYINDLSYSGRRFVHPSNFDALVNQGCGTRILIDYVKKDVISKRWTIKTLCFRHTNHQVVTTWSNKLEQALLNVCSDRPKKLLVFVNPYGGKGEGKSIFYNKVAPLLQLAGVKFEDVITESANHAREMLQKCSLNGIDGVVCVGGDGMFSEIFTGILLRVANEANGDLIQLRKRNLRVGVIPAGK